MFGRQYDRCCGASEPEASKRSSRLICSAGSQKVDFSVAMNSSHARGYAQLFKNFASQRVSSFPDGLNTISSVCLTFKLERLWHYTVNILNFLLLRRSSLQFTIRVYDAELHKIM